MYERIYQIYQPLAPQYVFIYVCKASDDPLFAESARWAARSAHQHRGAEPTNTAAGTVSASTLRAPERRPLHFLSRIDVVACSALLNVSKWKSNHTKNLFFSFFLNESVCLTQWDQLFVIKLRACSTFIKLRNFQMSEILKTLKKSCGLSVQYSHTNS